MNKKEQFAVNLLGQWYKTHNDIRREKAEIKAQQSINPKYSKEIDPHYYRLVAAIIIGFIAFIGAEPMKVFYRKNFGKGSINLFILGFCCLFFVVYGVYCEIAAIAIMARQPGPWYTWMTGASLSFYLTACFYFLLAHHCFKRGLAASKQATMPPDYEGDSEFFDFLLEKGWSQRSIQLLVEPGFTITFGVVVSLFFNLFAGLPLIACGISMWVYMIMKLFFFGNATNEKLAKVNEETKGTEDFYDVETS